MRETHFFSGEAKYFSIGFINILISQKYLFWGYSKWCQIKQSASGPNSGLSSNLLVAKKYKPYEIYRRMCDAYRETCFNPKIFPTGLAIDWTLRAWIIKTVNWVETQWLFDKENIPRVVVSKEVHADSVLGNERTHWYWFSW